MKLVFIHGVNVRNTGESYEQDEQRRNYLIRNLFLDKVYPEAKVEILSPYWGQHGVKHAWNQASYPDLALIHGLGGNVSTPASDEELSLILQELAADSPTPILTAARKDFPRTVEALLAPVVRGESDLFEDVFTTAQKRGLAEASMLEAAHKVMVDPVQRDLLLSAVNDSQFLNELAAAVARKMAQPPNPDPNQVGLGVIEDLGFKAQEFFDRVKAAPQRVLSPVLAKRRVAHESATQFLGDVFVYLKNRGTAAKPGPIVEEVLKPLRAAAASGEPLIVFTHSMGGNIFYDILTTYFPDLKVDLWVSVASQVGQFEEMKLFSASDPGVKTPDKIGGLKPNLKRWLNIFDPSDVLSFLAQPIFADVDADLEFFSGAGPVQAHGTYFRRPSFYDLIRSHV